MQKLEERTERNTPRDASQVRSNCGSVIKHDCGVGQVLQGSKTSSNNSDENQLPKERQNTSVSVYMLNMRGKPLMPTTPRKARILLKQGKAKVVQRTPFTIQLKYPTGETKQPITFGIDAGYSKIGFSATTEKQELISGELILRTDVSKKLTEKQMYRKNRRSKLWHRKPRFNNRKRDKGWLAPSIKHKLDSHIRLIQKIKGILPVTNIVVEVANFDIQKIKNPCIEGKEYQEGEQLGFWNTREYILHRGNHVCQICKGKSKDPILNVHHIDPRKSTGTNRPDNLITLCETCHKAYHKGDIKPNLLKNNNNRNGFKPETFMSTVRWKLINQLKEIENNSNSVFHTYGYITKHNRIKAGLQKTHSNDAFVIAGGNGHERVNPFNCKQTRRNNRCIQLNRNGFKPSIRKKRYKFQPNDLIRFKRKECRVKGVFNYGKWLRLADSTENIFNSNIENVELICYGKGIQFN
ncbi:MAG: hypothetical protein DDT42_01245 [candidate division WS2 bacterium]|uniref:HNH nuclease domain-containing protein n=1 Tax=Psychracetigena formicireducens TaxID=2986056 RepID=A0A9E2BLU7_PSYF1|nr:hypothetical protein [Candidatus Psychracetigena formicireducens]